MFDAVEFTQDAGGRIISFHRRLLIWSLICRHLVSMHTLAPPSLKEIILSTGSIGTPHILLHSGIGDDAELATLGIPSTLHLPDVGKNLTDHPGWSIIFSVNSTETVDSVYFRNTTFQREALAEWQASKTGYLTGGLANQIGFLRIRKIRGCWKMNRVRGMRRRITSYSLWCVHRHRFGTS